MRCGLVCFCWGSVAASMRPPMAGRQPKRGHHSHRPRCAPRQWQLGLSTNQIEAVKTDRTVAGPLCPSAQGVPGRCNIICATRSTSLQPKSPRSEGIDSPRGSSTSLAHSPRALTLARHPPTSRRDQEWLLTRAHLARPARPCRHLGNGGAMEDSPTMVGGPGPVAGHLRSTPRRRLPLTVRRASD